VIGGDGSMRGARRIASAIAARERRIAVVGVPKTIDNDIPYIGHSFGFQTAFGKATESIRAAHVEATAQPGGIGLVQLMGRHSGFIACYAALANNDADYVLIPRGAAGPRRLPAASARSGGAGARAGRRRRGRRPGLSLAR
jgi:6-phosphofructokinase 1